MDVRNLLTLDAHVYRKERVVVKARRMASRFAISTGNQPDGYHCGKWVSEHTFLR